MYAVLVLPCFCCQMGYLEAVPKIHRGYVGDSSSFPPNLLNSMFFRVKELLKAGIVFR